MLSNKRLIDTGLVLFASMNSEKLEQHCQTSAFLTPI